ncbi:hypothetical protein M2323_001481 [Rhodoblastus acidophilus]|uniref:Hint domain-containing protein n=1 Tax=Rhodoblastus acidophilus TaxID=1074 RepID=UPI0022256EFD|nr:Hint domain-containing protein [Rhodoblastus acidophilus]MCW2283872.1 hypothetical protein [Rhodoblastus acidophilus]MCW2332568.1 hypothetical protein [Rhodoblastus acidophilus]
MTFTLSDANVSLVGGAGDKAPYMGWKGGNGASVSTTLDGDQLDTLHTIDDSGLILLPQLTGGLGGQGGDGLDGYVKQWSGQPGGAGGAGGAVNATFSDNELGSSSVPVTYNFQFHLAELGGAGGAGGNGGDGVHSLNTTNIFFGAGYGAEGGAGGKATANVSNLVAFCQDTDATLQADATGGQGGIGGAGGFGAVYINYPHDAWFAGGQGGGGGAGGDAKVSVDSASVAARSIVIAEHAQGGRGGRGGGGGWKGDGSVKSPDGGGGGGGSASVSFSNTTLSATHVEIKLTTDAGGGGTGVLTGATGSERIDFENDAVHLLDTSPSAPDLLTLRLSATAGGGAVQYNLVALSTRSNGAVTGNLIFRNNAFIGSGASTLDLQVAGGGVNVDLLNGQLSIGGSDWNSLSGFTRVNLDSNDTVETVAGAQIYLGGASDRIVVTAGRVGGTIYNAAGASFILKFEGFSGLTQQALQQDSQIVGGDTVITIDGQSLTLAGYTGPIDASNTDITCFLEGTRIATARGETPVEALRIGDLALTSDGEAKPIRWIGRRTIHRRFADPLRACPIRIKAGALGDKMPRRDLLLSPDHALFISGALIHAGALVNGASILRETRVPERFTYFHVELADHDLVLAEGAAAETFVDNVDRMSFDNWAEYEAICPRGSDAAEMLWPRAKSARQIPRAIRALISARAKTLGLATADAA